MSVEGGPLGGGISIASAGAELASPAAFFESNMNIVSIIKAADVVMGPPVMVGGGIPIIHQAEAVASAVWEKTNPAQQFFENNMNIVSIINRFNPQPELNAADAISEAETILKQAARPQIVLPAVEPMIVPPPQPEVDTFFRPEPVIKSDQAVAQPAFATKPQAEQAAPYPTALGQPEQVTEQAEEVATTQTADQDKTRLAEQQYIEEERLINVEDWQVAQQRRFEISQAVQKAWAAVKEKIIFGWMVSKFLPGQHEGNTSQIVRKIGPDGSLVDTEQAIKTDPREFKSQEQAKEGLLPYVAIFKPAKKAKEGKRLSRQEVARVIRYLLVKPSQAYEVFIKRKFKKVGVYTEQAEIEVEEPSLASNPDLAAVLNPPVLTDLNSLS